MRWTLRGQGDILWTNGSGGMGEGAGLPDLAPGGSLRSPPYCPDQSLKLSLDYFYVQLYNLSRCALNPSLEWHIVTSPCSSCPDLCQSAKAPAAGPIALTSFKYAAYIERTMRE